MPTGGETLYPGRASVNFWPVPPVCGDSAQPLPLNPRQRKRHLGSLRRRTDPAPAPVSAQWRDAPTPGTLSFNSPTSPPFEGTQSGSVA